MIYKSLLKTALGVMTVGLLSLNACNYAKSGQNGNVQKENIYTAGNINVSNANNNLPTVKTELEKAKKDKKTVLLVVTGNDVKAENIIKISKDASNQVKQSVVIEMDRDDTANTDLVNEYRLSGAPLPLVIIIAKNGIPVGGLLEKDATVQNLMDAVPSVKTLEVITALSEGKSIFIIAYKKNAKEKKQVNENCLKACNQISTGVTVEIDVEDKAETKLIQQLRIDVNQNITIFVINPSGQITGTYTGIPDANNLVTDAKKVVKSSCCPGNNKTNCK